MKQLIMKALGVQPAELSAEDKGYTDPLQVLFIFIKAETEKRSLSSVGGSTGLMMAAIYFNHQPNRLRSLT